MKLKKFSAEQKKLGVIILVAFCVSIPAGAQIAKKYGRITYSHGLTYYGPDLPPATTSPASEKLLTASGEWATISGKIFPYILAYPKTLNATQFPNDPNDSIGIETSQKTAQQNLTLFVEKISYYDAKLTGEAKEFINNYWRYYSGLAGLKNLKEFTNPQGVAGFEANYTYKSGSGQSLDVFFVIKNEPDHLIHLMKGDLEEKVFREIVNKFSISNF